MSSYEANTPAQVHQFPDILALGIVQLLDEADKHIGDPDAVRSCLDRARAMLRAPDVSHRKLADSRMARWQVKRVVDHVRENIDTTIRCEDLANLCRLSVSHFSKVFRQTFDTSPHAYVLEMRIEHAKRLLMETDEPLALIALACGLSDQSHFSRSFRHQTGETPRAWRRKCSRFGC
ncbi:helix-turn-helix transcriptional regulator [Ensifer sp. ENS07]|uniref:helix-turn-helix domain-containing protein n=1 Tax=unclassified Ensifer TaxID=2633371 RepID=UPI00177F5625|nr:MULTISPECIES: AraC family transcriptional regulator [unclassified Ensifer]MBD9508123.1 helix-turn-helix transcriptional regulator [Ensifer sp. ENS10]MBD9637381.1 helix-turn-helix transcriptional regulator [Ensifer sp. ENS07]